MASFLESLRQEARCLEAALEAMPEYRKLREIRRLLELYGESGTIASDRGMGAPTRATPDASRAGPSRGISLKIVDVLRDFLETQSAPVPTRTLMDVLAQRGVEVRGKAPQNAVSSVMSKCPEFRSHGRSGWTLDRKSAGDDEDGQSLQSSPADETSAKGREAGPGGGG